MNFCLEIIGSKVKIITLNSKLYNTIAEIPLLLIYTIQCLNEWDRQFRQHSSTAGETLWLLRYFPSVKKIHP